LTLGGKNILDSQIRGGQILRLLYLEGLQTCFNSAVELHLSGSWLLGSPIILIGLAVRINVSRIPQN